MTKIGPLSETPPDSQAFDFEDCPSPPTKRPREASLGADWRREEFGSTERRLRPVYSLFMSYMSSDEVSMGRI